MNKTIHIILISVSFIFLSCSNKEKNEEKDIQNRLGNINSLLSTNSFNAAKMELDSIHILYPRKVDARRTAKALEDTITIRESRRTSAYCDSILPIKQFQADSIQKNFRFEKNDTYQTIGNYVYKTLRIESNIDRTYLRAYVDENADFYLISNFTGSYKLQHSRVKVSYGDTYAVTDSIPVNNPMNHHFAEDGSYWEVVTFKNESAGNVPVFINQYSKDRLKITLEGRRNYIYYLTDADKKALSETYNLWVAKKDVLTLQKEIEKAESTIERIQSKYNKNDE